MTGIGGITGAGAPVMETKAPGAMDQTDFLRLMTTQLLTQDPFDPIDNTQMVAQMAQFSQVAGIAEMNASLKALVAGMDSSRLGDAAGWIGRSMLTLSDHATPLHDGAYAGEIGLAADAARVTLSFVDETGAVVHSQDLGPQAKGDLSFAWDGRDADGEPVGKGPLRLVVTAQDANGAAIQSTTAAWTVIGGIQSPANGGATRLVTGLGLLDPQAAIRLA